MAIVSPVKLEGNVLHCLHRAVLNLESHGNIACIDDGLVVSIISIEADGRGVGVLCSNHVTLLSIGIDSIAKAIAQRVEGKNGDQHKADRRKDPWIGTND